MAKVLFENKYKCENCGHPLGTHNGEYWHGLLLCNDCRAIVNVQLENGKYDCTGAGFPMPSV